MQAPSQRFLQNCSYYESRDIDDYFVLPGKIDLSGETAFLHLPNGTTAQRGPSLDGRIRFNSDTLRYEVTSGQGWYELPLNGGGAAGVVSLSATNGTAAWAVASGGDRLYSLTLTGDTTLALPTGFEAGAEHTLIVKQDGTGGHALTFPSGYALDWRAVNAPSTFALANAVSVFKVISDGSGVFCTALVFISPAELSWSDFERLTTLQMDSTGNVAWPMGTRLAEVTLTGTANLSAPTGQQAGREYTLIVKQDATGGHTMTFDPAYTLADPTAQPDPAASKATVFKFDCDGANLYGFSTRPAAAAGAGGGAAAAAAG